jgi:hypothetical protein
MTVRMPAATSDHPRCFGVSHNEDDRDCKRCPVRAQCAGVCQSWRDRRSLAEAEADATHLPEDDDDGDPEGLLKEIVREHIGRPPRYIDSAHRRKVRLGLAALRAELRARTPTQSLRVWIEAQVGAMQSHIAKSGAILPGQLFGPDAERRYRGHVRYLNRNFVDATLRVRMHRSARVDEMSFEIAEVLRACWLDGVATTDHPHWKVLSAAAQKVVKNADQPLGRACALRAACDFLHQLRPGIQHRITAPESWDWTAFLTFIHTHFPAAESANSAPVDLGGVTFADGLHRLVR